ncbi:hypothetical protein V9L05_18165 [Bernardetia sp. Wsw4-3y2]|uniref:hypothetical protein n=1 Tax=Bernardetia sp. Wsw4-3y2 TaxID=3127471 RepID=UPI0030CB6F8F
METEPQEYRIKKTDTLFQFYEELEAEMNECYFSSDDQENEKRTSENMYTQLFDDHLANNIKESPSDDLLREIHTICKDPQINRLVEVQIEKIIREELLRRKEEARLKVIEVYHRIQQPTQTEQVA